MNDIVVSDEEFAEIFDGGRIIEVKRRKWKGKELIKVLHVPVTRRTELYNYRENELALAMLYTGMREAQLAALTEKSFNLILETGHELNSKRLEEGGQAAKKLAEAVTRMFNG